MKKIILLSLISAAFVAGIWTFFGFYTADQNYAGAQSALVKGDYLTSLSKANKAVLQNPNEPLYYRGRAKVLLAAVASVPRVGDDDAVGRLLLRAHARQSDSNGHAVQVPPRDSGPSPARWPT